MWWKWHVAMPALAAVFGYVPRSGSAGWKTRRAALALSWVRSQARFEDAYTRGPLAETAASRAALPGRFARLSAPMLAIGLDDDAFGTIDAIERLAGYYTGSDVTHLRLAPHDIGVAEIGHFAFFHTASPTRLAARAALAAARRVAGRCAGPRPRTPSRDGRGKRHAGRRGAGVTRHALAAARRHRPKPAICTRYEPNTPATGRAP
jgi:hypothetical protein